MNILLDENLNPEGLNALICFAMTYKILPLYPEDIPLIEPLQPEGWGSVTTTFRQYIGQPNFVGVKVMKGAVLVGVGKLIVNGSLGWLGNIMTHPDFRREGIGKMATLELIQQGKDRGLYSFLLIATEMGEPLYRRIGFESVTSYLFFRKSQPVLSKKTSPSIRSTDAKDHALILALDQMGSGEDRADLLRPYLQRSWVYENDSGAIEGFYLPDLGDGLIVARSTKAGLELVKMREAEGGDTLIFPEPNQVLQQFLQEQGYTCYLQSPMMKMGPMKDWHPEMIYGRIGGNLG